MLEIGRKHDGLVASFAGKLDTKVPCLEGDEDKIKILRCQVFRGEGVKAVDCISESSRVSDMFPRQSRKTSYRCETNVLARLVRFASNFQLPAPC